LAEIHFDREHAFQTMTELCDIGPRVIGSEGEAQAARFVENRFIEYGLDSVRTLRYPIRYYDGKKAEISTIDRSLSVAGVPCWMSPSTEDTGIVAPTTYVGLHQLVSNLDPDDVDGKIVFVLMQEQYTPDVLMAWKRIFEMNVAGVVFLDIQRNQAPRSYNNEMMNDILSLKPCMTASAELSRLLHDRMFGSELRLFIQGDSKEGTIHNVSGTVKGALDQTILLCAHMDTVPFSVGATDNAAGVAILLEMARIMSKKEPRYTYKFVAFGGEELGMKGSERYVEEQNLGNLSLCMNFDSIGATPGSVLAFVGGGDTLVNLVSRIAASNQYPTRSIRASGSGGDNKIFASRGIPTLHLAFQGTTSGKVSHSSIDEPSLLDSSPLAEVGLFSLGIIDEIELLDADFLNEDMPQDLIDSAKRRLGIE
jgi:hypothetical protein